MPNASSKNKTCSEKRSRFSQGGHGEAQTCCTLQSLPLPVSHFLSFTGPVDESSLTHVRRIEKKDDVALSLLREGGCLSYVE